MKCSALMGCCSAFRVFNHIRDENPPDMPSAPNTACPHSCAVPDEFVVSGSHFKTPLPVSKPERLVLSESTNSSSGKSVSSHSASRPKSASHLGRSTAGTTPGDSGWDSSSVTPSSVSVFDFSHSNRWRWPSANSTATATTTTPPAAWYHSSSPGDAPVGQPLSAPPTTGVGVVASLSSAACHSHATCSPSPGPSHSDTHLPAPITITTIKTNSDRHNPPCARQDALSVATSAFHVPHNATSSSNAASSDSVCSPACRAPLLCSSTYAVSGNVTCSEAPIPYNSTNLLHPLPGAHTVMAASYNLHRDRVHSEDYGSNKKAEPTELESPTKSRPLTLNIRTKTSYGSMPVLTLLRTLPQPCYVSAAPRKECEQASVRALALPLLLTQTASPSCPCLPCIESAVQSENATPECTKGGNSARCSDSEPAGSSALALRQPNESILIASSDVNHLCVSTSAGVSPIALGSIVTPNTTTTTTSRPLEEDKGDTNCVPLLGQTQPVPLQQSSAPRQRVTYSLPSSPQLSVGKFHQRDGTGNVLHKTFTSMHLPSLGPVGRGQYSGTDPRKTVSSETQNEPSVPSESSRQESYTNQVVELIRDNQPHANHVQGPQCKSLQGAVVILNGDRCSPLSSSSESSPSGMTADSTPTTAKDASSNSNVTGLIGGPRFKLLLEGDVQLCRLNHPRTVISKILSSKFLRRWESHHLYLNDACLSSKTPMGFMESSVPYSQMEEISIVLGWDAGHRFCLRIMLPHGSLLIQANNAYTRDQWYHSILWKKYVFRYHQVLRSTTRPDVLLKELKHMVDLATSTPLQDDCITQAPLEVISSLLSVETMALSKGLSEELLSTLAPLLERQHPSREMCSAFSRHCAMHPRSALVHGLFTTVVHRILKHNVDFGKNPYMRRFVQDYIRVVFAQNDGPDAIRAFVQSVHGAGSACPHPRVLPNLVAVCLAAVFAVYDARRQKLSWEHNNLNKLSPHRPDNYIKSWIQTKTLISQIQQQDGVTTHSASPLSSLLEQRISSPSSWIHASSQAQVHTQPCYTSPGHKRKTSTESYTGTLSRDDMSENLLLVEEKPSTTTEPNTRGGSSSSGTTTSTSSSSAASPLHVDGDVFSLEWSEGVPSRSSNASLENISDTEMQLNCYLTVFQTISEYEDWRPSLAQLLQPIPFPDDALADAQFIKGMIPVIESVGTDSRCEVHQLVLGIREGKEGWFHVFCPSSAACPDEGTVWSGMLKTLLECCCRRKRFLATLTKWVGAFQLLALRDNGSAQDVLSLMLEWDLLEGNEEDKNALPMQVVTTLQSTASGRWKYAELCNRQMHLKALQQKGGPKKLTLPSRSTDADLEKMLSCGSFGNLECLSLAFTQVTSACAEHLIKLPSLRYLNLWSTQFGDSGLQLISEHLHKLQVLNLCETPVTDKGLTSLAVMKSLRKLNLNSTSLSAQTFEQLKQKLPSLQECDIRYTDAW